MNERIRREPAHHHTYHLGHAGSCENEPLVNVKIKFFGGRGDLPQFFFAEASCPARAPQREGGVK